VNSIGLPFIFRLLEILFNVDVGCHVAGSYPTDLAGGGDDMIP
jgi:hypothetical protein